ncbi:MAG: flippase [Terriglobia bacterium]|nr:flippase [Terriglobia bacterium]
MAIPESAITNLTSRKHLLRNSIINLLGDGAPFVVAVIAIPRLIDALGTARFGVLTLIWMVISYFTVFDLGVGRALTNLISRELGKGDETSIGPLAWTAIMLTAGLGTLGGILLAGCSHWLVYSVLRVPESLCPETVRAFQLFAISIPAVLTTTGFRGILEAYHRFDIAVSIRGPMTAYNFGAPLAVLPFSHSLVPIIVVLLVGRYVSLLLHFTACITMFQPLRPIFQWRTATLSPLLTFGGWLTVSNVITPVMSGMDRFLVGALVSIQAVAYYATPYEIITKLLIVSGAVGGVFFPTFSSVLMSDVPRTSQIYARATRFLVFLLLPTTVLAIILARPGLRLWLGQDFASHSTLVLQILSIGVMMNALASLPYALVQGAGRADWTAKMHMVEMPVYLGVFWLLTTRFNIVGAAIAWAVHTTLDLIILRSMARRVLTARLPTL